MRGLLVVLIVAGGLFATALSSYAGLLLYSWFAFFRPQEWSWGAVDSLRLSLVIGIVFLISALARRQFPKVLHPLSIGMLLFVLCGLLSQYGAVSRAAGWEGLDMLVRMVVVSLLAITIVDSRQRFVLLVAVVAGSLAFHSSKFGVGYLIRGGAQFNAGVGGLFSDNNDFALAIARILFPLVAVAQNTRARWVKLGIVAAVPLSVIAIISTFSRGGVLAFVAALVAFILLQRRRVVTLIVLAVIVGAGYYYVPVPEEYKARLTSVQSIDDISEGSALGRLHFWSVAIAMARDRPLGVGLRGYPYAYDRYDFSSGAYGTERAVHSSHFQVLAELGYPGTVVWIYLHACAFWLLWRIRRRARAPDVSPQRRAFLVTSANALAASIVAFIVGGAFLAQALNDLNWMTFALVAALDRLSLEPEAEEEAVVVS